MAPLERERESEPARATPRWHQRPPLRVEASLSLSLSISSLVSPDEPEPKPEPVELEPEKPDEEEPDDQPQADLPHRPPPVADAEPDEPDPDELHVGEPEVRERDAAKLSSALPLTFAPTRSRTAPLPVPLPLLPPVSGSSTWTSEAAAGAGAFSPSPPQHPPSGTPTPPNTTHNGQSGCEEQSASNSGLGVASGFDAHASPQAFASVSSDDAPAPNTSSLPESQSASNKAFELFVNARSQSSSSSGSANGATSTNSFGLPAAIAVQRAGELTPDSLSPSPTAAVAATPPAPHYCSSGPHYIDFSVLMRSTSSSSSSTCSTTSNNSSLSGGASVGCPAPELGPDPRIYGKRFAAMVRPRLLLSDFVDVTDTLPAPDAAPDYILAHPTAGDGDGSDDEEQMIEPEPDSPDGDATNSMTAAERLACSLPLAAFHFVGAGVRVGKSLLRSASATSVSASTPEVTASELKVCAVSILVLCLYILHALFPLSSR